MTEEPLHPLLQQLDPSDEQRPAVLDRGHDVAVTAGAGAGKTRILVARYLALLLDGLDLRRVVAITFTKKAAREMRNRVRKEVRHYLESGNLDDAERGRWLDIYTRLDAARIGTIHSLCGEILRHHPAEAGIDPLFEVLEEGQVARLQARAVDETLAWAADDEDGVELFALLGEAGLRSLVQTMLQQRLDAAEALAALPADPAALCAFWEGQLAARRKTALAALRRQPAFDPAVALLRQIEPLDPGDAMAGQRAQVLAGLEEPAGTLACLGQVRLTGGRQGAWPGGKDELDQVKGALRTLRDLWQGQQEWLTLALDPLDEALAAHTPILRAAFAYAVERYTALKDGLRVLDFDDLEAGAVRLLRDFSAVGDYWREEVQALLVDEFQDTNHRQRDLLDLLNGDGQKLLIVGDAKQSIYRFRGADVTVFRQKWAEIAGAGRGHTLATSYRAHRGLIAALNALLEPVLGPAQDADRPYVEPFAALEHYRVNPAAGLSPPHVLLQLAQGENVAEARARAAQALVDWLVELVEAGRVRVKESDPESGEERERALHYGDVAILCRATASFAAYENALEAAGVPFLTVAGRGFYERPEVRDLLNALQSLADPTDDVALAGLLRSPAGGLSDMALYRLAEARAARLAASLWSVLAGGDLSFLQEEAETAARARDLVRALHEQAGRVPVADVLKALLDETDYCAALLRAGQSRGVRNLDKLLADAHTSEIVGVGAFLEYVQQLRDAGTREGEAYTVTTGALQLFTVHAAKGLEFPIVVIGDAARKPPGSRGVLVDRALGVLPPLQREEDGGGKRETRRPAIYGLVLHSAQDQEAAESDRLLYVAATRAREMLVISGTITGKLTGWLERLGAALPLAEVLEAVGTATAGRWTWSLGGQPVGCVFYPLGAAGAGARASAAAAPAVTLPDAPALLSPVAPAAGRSDDKARAALQETPQRVWRVVPEKARPTAPAWVVGQIVHGALAGRLLPRAIPEEIAAWAAAEARSCGLTDGQEIHDAVTRAARMLRRFQETDLYREMERSPRRFHEVPYSLLVDGKLEYGVIDVLFESPAGWVLVEFKTDRVRDRAELEARLAEKKYVEQVRRYRDAAEQLLGGRPRPILCFLNCGGGVELVEDG